MEGREHHDPGYDDWFDEPEAPTDTRGDVAPRARDAEDEVWVLPEDEEPRRTARREIVVAGRTLTMTQAAIIVVSFVVLLIAILAAAGAFSGSKAAAPPVTTPSVPTVPPTTSSATTNTTPAATAPSQTLSPGATGSEVKTLQQALTALGYSPGKADGDYGPSTQAAVAEFQKANGLAADGVVGPATLAKLQQALSG